MRPEPYDMIVLGAGPAGQSAAELAAWFGTRVVIVERSKPGGIVTTTGGAPTKTLREAVFDLDGGTSFDTARPIIRARTVEVCETLQTLATRQIASRGIEYVEGRGRLGPDRNVAVALPDGSSRVLAAPTILIATGSRPAHLAGVPLDDPDVYDSDEVYSLRRVPKDVVVVGGGPVGVEFTTILTALRVPVTLVDKGQRLLPSMDGELTQLMVEELQRRGVRLIFGAGVESVSRTEGRLTLTLSNGTRLAPDTALFAAGRKPNTDGLGLETAGVELDRRGRILVDRYYRTTCPGIYAVGDVTSPTLASVATQQGRAAACHALGLAFGMAVDRAGSSAVYGLPELAGVGLTEEQLRETGQAYVAGRCDLSQTARGVIARRGGLLKLLVAADDRKLLGVHCFGDIASELVGMGHAVLHMGGAIDVFLMLALNTPTYSAAYREAAIDAMNHLADLAGHRRPMSIYQEIGDPS
jgi:NAD(P) transhydrogenase